MRSGDIMGFLGKNPGSHLINLFTYGLPLNGLSHVGIVADYQGDLVLFESTTWSTEPCLIQGKQIKGVQVHKIIPRIDKYEGRVWHYPLTKPLNLADRQGLTDFLLAQVGKGYDAVGAFRSGGEGFSWLESKLHHEHLTTLFCSEMCAAAHREVNRFQTTNAGRWNPNSFTRAEISRGTLSKPIRFK
jgi:hypothetical protein